MLREVTEKESLRTLRTVFKDDHRAGINYKNHRKVTEDTYRITAQMLSLAAIIKLLDRERVEDVYWHPSAAPPDSHVSQIAMRYALYIKYKKVKKVVRRRRTKS